MKRYGPSITHYGVVIFLVVVGAASASAASLSFVTDPNTLFTVVPFPHQNDPFNDLQTGQPDADIVGNANSPGFLTGCDGTYVYYRVRLGATDLSHGVPTYAGLFWIGIDGNGDGVLDLFIGINNSGSSSQIQFMAPGTGLNDSPKTTSIRKLQAGYSIAENSSNYNYQSVNSTLQPGITTTDLNADGRIDSFLTIRVPFTGVAGTATLQGAMAGLGNRNITASTPLSYVIATSTESNSLNQDIGGIDNKTANLAQTYIQLGAITRQLNLNGTPYNPPPTVPEPATVVTIGAGLTVLVVRATRRPGNYAAD